MTAEPTVDNFDAWPDGEFTSRFIVAFCLAGYHVLTDEVDCTIRRVGLRFGAEGRERMSGLPDLRAYPSDSEVQGWLDRLIELERHLEQERSARLVASDANQLRFPWS